MNAHPIHPATYLDLLFQNRNKAYGGYELRSRYPARLKRALGAVFGAVAVCSIYAISTGQWTPVVRSVLPLHHPDTLASIAALKLPEPVAPAAPAGPAPAAAPAPADAVPAFSLQRDSIPTDAPEPVPVASGAASGTSVAGVAGGAAGGVTGGVRGGDAAVRIGGETPPPATAPVSFAEVPPTPPFDVNAYLSEHIRYPEAAREAGIEGRVVLKFVVNEDGDISDVQVARKVDPQLDAEAVRVVKSMPKWKPGRQNGRPVNVYFNLPVSFLLQ